MYALTGKSTQSGKRRCGTTYLEHENMPNVLTEKDAMGLMRTCRRWKGRRTIYKLRRGRGTGRRRSQSGCRLGGARHICDHGYRKRQPCSGREAVGPHDTKTPADLRRGRLQRS
eukprot:6179322-Pleurochrysis_carterae.AAC.1